MIEYTEGPAIEWQVEHRNTLPEKLVGTIKGLTVWAEDDGSWHVFGKLGNYDVMVSGRIGSWFERSKLLPTQNILSSTIVPQLLTLGLVGR